MFLRAYVLHIYYFTHWSWMHWSFIHSCILRFLHYHYYAIRTHIWWSKTWKAYLLHAIYYIVSHSFSVSFDIPLRRQNCFAFKFVPLTRKKLFPRKKLQKTSFWWLNWYNYYLLVNTKYQFLSNKLIKRNEIRKREEFINSMRYLDIKM